MKHRVIQWGTGFVGKMTLKAIIDSPDLELAGLIVHSPDRSAAMPARSRVWPPSA